MFCSRCGKEISNDASFCPYCGMQLDRISAIEEGAAGAFGSVAVAAENVADKSNAVAEEAAKEVKEVAEEAKETVSNAVSEAKEAAEEIKEVSADAAAAEAVISNVNADIADAAVANTAEPAKKKSKLPIILALVLVVLGVAGYFIYNNLPSTKSGKLIKQIDQLISEEKYEDALQAAASAKELTPDNAAVFQAYDKIFEAQCKQYLTEDGKPKSLNALELYVEAAKIVPESKDKYLAKASEYFKYTAEIMLKLDNPSTLRALVSYFKEYSEKEGVPGLAASIASLEAQAEKLERAAAFKEFGNQLKAYVDKGDHSGMISAVLLANIKTSDVYKKVLQPAGTISSNFPIITDVDGTTKKVGVYYKNGLYHVYYGDYDANNKRSGEGIWIPVVNNGLTGDIYHYYYDCEWANDKPNGKVKAYIDYTRSGTKNAYEIDSNAIDGYLDGETKYSYDNGANIYTVNIIKGEPQLIETDSKGRKIYGYNQDKSRILINMTGPITVYGAY